MKSIKMISNPLNIDFFIYLFLQLILCILASKFQTFRYPGIP